MTWTRLDDRFPWHRKIRGLGDAAFRLHVSALCWSNEHLTDGKILTAELSLTSDVRMPKRAASSLVAHGVWDETEYGWELHDFLEYNEPRAVVLARRHADAERKRKGRESRWSTPCPGGLQSDSARTPSAVQPESSRPDPARPDPKSKPLAEVPLALVPAESLAPRKYSPEFDEFWLAYDHKVDKPAADKAYKAARKRTTHDQLVTTARAYRDTFDRTGTKFMPHAATWLNADRWDEPIAGTKGSGVSKWGDTCPPGMEHLRPHERFVSVMR